MDIAAKAIAKYGAKQNYDELAGFLSWLESARDVVSFVEVGTRTGGTLWAVQQVRPDLQCVAIDTNIIQIVAPLRPGTCVLPGKSSNPAIVELAMKLIEPSSAVVFIDANHAYEAVKQDAILFRCRYQGFHDIVPTRNVGDGVARFYQEHGGPVVSEWRFQYGIGVRAWA